MNELEDEPAAPPLEDDGAVARAEATGETVGEAKWAALRELERRFPGLDKARVRFQILSEGERGLLGVGYAPARVVAEAPQEGGPSTADVRAAEPPGSAAARLRELLERIAVALRVDASVAIAETDSALVGTFTGRDVGLLIGKHGQTIDAVQYVANALLWRDEEARKEVVIDAAGYRARRRASLERIAERAARDAIQTGQPVVLDPMSASERKLVHLFLQERPEVTTASEGAEPNRCVVVAPVTRDDG